LVSQPISLLFKALQALLTAMDSVLHFLYEVQISVCGLAPIHYDRSMTLFQPAMKDKSEYWWAFDITWVSIQCDYTFCLYASHAWKGRINPDRHYIMREWEKGLGF
jgi:hypothetical protein